MGTQLCTSQDVADWWSVDGVLSRLDDDYDNANNAAELAMMLRIIEAASTRVLFSLAQRYATTALTGSNPPTDTPAIVRYFAAIISAYNLSIHRGQSPTMAFEQLYKDVCQQLEEVKKGVSILPGVYNPLSGLPFTNSYQVDGRYYSAKLRRVFVTSTGPIPSRADGKYHPEQYLPLGPE